MNPKIGLLLALGAMVATGLFYREEWPLWPTYVLLGIGLIAMTLGAAREKRRS